MPIEHAATPWGNFLRAVRGARGANVQVLGQPLEDNLRAVVMAEDASHLMPATRWTQSGWRSTVVGVAATNARVEIRANNAFWLTQLQSSADAAIEILDAHLLATADIAPQSQYGDAPQVRFREGTNAVPPNAASYVYSGTPVNAVMNGRGLFCPRGRIMSITVLLVAATLEIDALIVEIPDPTTAE